jgi:hypothetical protein
MRPFNINTVAKKNCLNIRKVITLKKFVRYMKNRLVEIHGLSESGYYCGKLVTHRLYGGPPKTKRCFGYIESYGCYNCNPTGIQCQGGCGDWVIKEGFCSWSCRGEYYKGIN